MENRLDFRVELCLMIHKVRESTNSVKCDCLDNREYILFQKKEETNENVCEREKEERGDEGDGLVWSLTHDKVFNFFLKILKIYSDLMGDR